MVGHVGVHRAEDAQQVAQASQFREDLADGHAGLAVPLFGSPRVEAAPSRKSAAETAVKELYGTLTDKQVSREELYKEDEDSAPAT